MAIPHPSERVAGYGQDKEFRVEMASRVLLDMVDAFPSWESVAEQLAQRLRLDLNVSGDRPLVQDALLTAELDLEWTNEIVYGPDGRFRRPGLGADPTPMSRDGLREVSEAIWALGWPSSGRKPSRTIYECFQELGGEYRHCDVYWAMHEHLKGSRLRVVRRNWMLLEDVQAMLADTTRSVGERDEIVRELERDLVVRYVAWLGRSDVRKFLFRNGREADLYDSKRRLIIEAKVDHRDDVLVAHGMGQAMYYRSLDDLGPDNDIAVLLPGRPSEDVLSLLRIHDVVLIYRDGEEFREVRP